MIPVFILSACAPAVQAGPEQLPNLQVRESPTIVEPTTAAQSTESVLPIDTAEPSFDIRLSTIMSGAKVLRRGEITEVQQAQSANIQVQDGIQVAKLEEQKEQSYSILDFSDNMEVELFSNTAVFITGLNKEAGDSTHINLRLDAGNMFVHLNDQTASRVTVETLDTSITTLTDGTEFDVCYNEELTCILVKQGVVEVTAQGRQQIVKAGEAGLVLKDEHPSPILCAPTSVFIGWEGRYRQFADTQALDKELSLLPQRPCPVTAAGLPTNARILYQDEFRRPASGWTQEEVDNFIVGYYRLPGRRQYRYYQVQVRGPHDQYLAFVPKEDVYGDVNIDTKVSAEAASSGDFRYGPIFRRSGDQYYAFIVSPVTKTWSFIKSSSTGLETLREGTDEHIRGLKARDTLRVESYGSNFLLFINGGFVDWISDPDYVSGEAGLFVDTIDSPDAIIRFDSIFLWEMPPDVLNPITGGREYCFNARDDDGDRLIDRADPDCQRLGLAPTSIPPTNTPRPTNTLAPRPTLTPQPTNTPIPQPTNTPGPTNTRRPTRTRTPQPTNPPPATNTPQPPTNPPPTNPPPTNPPPTNPPPTDPPPTNPPPTDPPPTTYP